MLIRISLLFILVLNNSANCFAAESPITPAEIEATLRELGKAISDQHTETMKDSEGQKGRLLYLHKHTIDGHDCDITWQSTYFARLLKNQQELTEFAPILTQCKVVSAQVSRFVRIYEYASIAAENAENQKRIKKMLRQDISKVVSAISWAFFALDIKTQNSESVFILFLYEKVREHLNLLKADMGDLRLNGEFL